MKAFKSFIGLLAMMTLIGLSACQKDSLTSQPEADQYDENTKRKPGNNCFNFRTSAETDLGCACILNPLDCTPDAPVLCNFGSIPTSTATFGNYSGYMTSIVTGLEQSGNPPNGNGALHITLIHYFVSHDGNHAFWTQDQAICAPGNNPNSCIVNDVLDIIGGCGDFEEATGRLHTHGVLSFDGGAELCPIFYLGGSQDYVPTGTLNIDWHGRICTS